MIIPKIVQTNGKFGDFCKPVIEEFKGHPDTVKKYNNNNNDDEEKQHK